MKLAHKLSMQLRAAEERINQLEAGNSLEATQLTIRTRLRTAGPQAPRSRPALAHGGAFGPRVCGSPWRARAAYDNYVSGVTKLGELYSDLAREAFKPYQTFVARVTPR